MKLVIAIYNLMRMLPKEEKFGLKSQMTRAAISIPSNIAEGSSRSSPKEFKHFLEMSLGSAFELETQLLSIKELGLAPEDQINGILNTLNEEQKMINSFINKLKS
jgi:four helix bundle protein